MRHECWFNSLKLISFTVSCSFSKACSKAQSTSPDILTLSIKADFGAAANSFYISKSAWAGCVGRQHHWWLQWQCSMWWIILCWPWPAQGVSVMLLQAKWIWPQCRHQYWRAIFHNYCDFRWCQLKLFWAMSQHFGAVGQAKDCFH